MSKEITSPLQLHYLRHALKRTLDVRMEDIYEEVADRLGRDYPKMPEYYRKQLLRLKNYYLDEIFKKIDATVLYYPNNEELE